MNGRRTIDWEPIDPVLREIYKNRDRGALQKLSQKLGIPATTLSQHARRALCVMGVNRPRRIFTKYKLREDDLLIKHYPAPIWQLQHILAANGYTRSARSIISHLAELRRSERIMAIDDAIEDSEHITTTDLAEAMGISPRKIHVWINNKLLPVLPDKSPHETRVHRYRIQRKDLHDFLMMYPGHWDSKSCDHFWLVDILTAPVLTAPAKIHRQDKAGMGDNGEHALRIAA